MEPSRISPQRLHEEESIDNKNLTVLHLREQFDKEKSRCCFFDRSYKVFEKLAALAEELELKNKQLENEMNNKVKVVSLLESEKNKLQAIISEFETEKLLFAEERSELEDLVHELKIESAENWNMKTEVAEKLNKSEDELCLIRDRIMELEKEIKYDKMAFESKERELEIANVRISEEKDKMLELVIELELQKNELEDKLTKSDQKVDKLENENKILKNSELKSDLDRKKVIEKLNDLEADILLKNAEKKEFEEKIKNIITKLDEKEAEKNVADVQIVRLEAENDLMKVENKIMKDKISKQEQKIVELQLDDISDKQDIEIKAKTTEEYIEDEKVLFEEDLRRSTPDGAISERRPTPPQITNKTKSRIIKSPRDGKHHSPFYSSM